MTAYRGGGVPQDPPAAGERNAHVPCRQCQDLAPVSTVAACGTLCFPCFKAYQRHGPQVVPNAFRQYPPQGGDSDTVRDMKTRLKGRFAGVHP